MSDNDGILQSPSDFMWHKASLDLAARQRHVHEGEPTHYPCKVLSHFYSMDGTRQPDKYEHTFVYRVKVKCPHCGKEDVRWSDEPQTGTMADNAAPGQEGSVG